MTMITTELVPPAGKVCPRCAHIVPVLVEGSDVCISCDGLIDPARWQAC